MHRDRTGDRYNVAGRLGTSFDGGNVMTTTRITAGQPTYNLGGVEKPSHG